MAAIRTLVIAIAVALSTWLPTSPMAADDAAVLRLLSEPRTHAVMRHALAPGTGDPADFAIGDCTTQRNLNEAGRSQARAIGAALSDGGVTFDSVLTSQWCRCRETAVLLGLGTPRDEPAINSFFRDFSTREEQTAATRRILAALPADHTAMLVTHQVNITALTGVYPRSGEVVIVRLEADGTLAVRGRFLVPE